MKERCFLILNFFITQRAKRFFINRLAREIRPNALILLLLIIHRMVVLLFEPLKLVVKLPVLKVVDSIAGIAVAILETILIVWAIYCVVIIVGVDPVLDWIKRCTAVNPVMKVLYDYNYLYALVYKIFGKISAIDKWTLVNVIRSI